jgi:hypothetical protein
MNILGRYKLGNAGMKKERFTGLSGQHICIKATIITTFWQSAYPIESNGLNKRHKAFRMNGKQ